MSMTTKGGKMDDIPGWSFRVEEVSAGVYRVRGLDEAGHSVEATGTDPDDVMEECRRSAARIHQASSGGGGRR